MKTLCKIFAGMVFTLTLNLVAQGKEWRGIRPLHSTREDVTRLLGPSPDANDIRANYSLEKEDVYLVFSQERWPQCATNLPQDIVLLIEVTPKKTLSLADLPIDETRLRKFDPSSPPGIGFGGYIDEEEGIVIRTQDGRVDEVCYIASAKDNGPCPEYYERPEAFIQLFVDFFSSKFDEYEKLSFGEEKPRLDNLAIQLQQDPGSVSYIIAYAGRRAYIGEAKAHAERAKKYMVKVRGVDSERIITIDGGYRENPTVDLYVQRSGLPGPAPSPTVQPKDVQLINGKRRNRQSRGKP